MKNKSLRTGPRGTTCSTDLLPEARTSSVPTPGIPPSRPSSSWSRALLPGAGPPRTYNNLDELVADVENARVWGGLHYRSTMTKTAKHFPRITRDVGRHDFLADANRGGKKHGDD